MEKLYWRINTDAQARQDVRTCDLWYAFNMAFTGDYYGSKYRHAQFLLKIRAGDEIFMHHSELGIVGCGEVTCKWQEGEYFTGDHRILYQKEPFEYRLEVYWKKEFDCRRDPVPISGRLPYLGTYCHIDTRKWDVESLKRELELHASRCKD